MKSFTLCALLICSSALVWAQKSPGTRDTLVMQPEFPGGAQALAKFMNKNLKVPLDASNRKGTSFVSFVVQKDGSLTDIKILKRFCDSCDENALEVLRKMPKWLPGKIDGKPARVRMVIPVKFGISK